ncbi:MAG TPA: hypothetical protein VHT51_16875, partial [Micropepsaceae bacterium]|nr:hypothetical protein [Micropepsaceae bacterium]
HMMSGVVAVPTTSDDPKYWHNRAKEVRSKAGVIVEPRIKSKMIKLAESYQKIAQRTEDRLRLSVQSRNPHDLYGADRHLS